jgi:hypothetical protein
LQSQTDTQSAKPLVCFRGEQKAHKIPRPSS